MAEVAEPAATKTAMAANFFDWRELFPELEILLESISIINEEIETVGQWMPWPEDHFADNVRGTGRCSCGSDDDLSISTPRTVQRVVRVSLPAHLPRPQHRELDVDTVDEPALPPHLYAAQKNPEHSHCAIQPTGTRHHCEMSFGSS